VRIIRRYRPFLCLVRIIRRYRPFLCLVRIIKRQRECQELMRPDIPYGCTDKLTLFRVLKVLVFPFRGQRELKQKLPTYHSKKIIWLRSTKEVEDFLAQLEPYAYEKRKLSKASSAAKNRHLAVAKRKPILQIY
jgi:hypothetical protein